MLEHTELPILAGGLLAEKETVFTPPFTATPYPHLHSQPHLCSHAELDRKSRVYNHLGLSDLHVFAQLNRPEICISWGQGRQQI